MIIDKNPYEKDDVEVPNFGDQNTGGGDPIFNMDTTSVSRETESFDIEEEAESSSKVAIVVLVVFLVLFLIGSVTGWIFGISKSKEVTSITEEYDAYKVKTKKQITDLEAQVSTLKLLVEQAKPVESETGDGTTSSGEGTKTEANTFYLMEDGVAVRTGAGTSFDVVNYDKLPNDIKDLVFYDKDSKKVTTRKVKFQILETKNDSSNTTWGKICDGAWVCLKYGTKQ